MLKVDEVDKRWEVYEVVHEARENLENLMYNKKNQSKLTDDVFKILVDMENNILNNKPLIEK